MTTVTPGAVEPKPCPFCNSPAELERGNDHHGDWFNLGCSRHWGHQRNPDHTNTCIAGRMFYTEIDVPEAEAIAAWNNRAAPHSEEAPADVLAGVKLGLEAACKALWDKRRHLSARDCAMIQELDPAAIAAETPLYATPPALQAVVEAWLPIESAPRDEEILAAIFVRNNKTGQSWWERRVIVIDSEEGRIIDTDYDHGWDADDYSHWMPLPKPPALSLAGGEHQPKGDVG